MMSSIVILIMFHYIIDFVQNIIAVLVLTHYITQFKKKKKGKEKRRFAQH